MAHYVTCYYCGKKFDRDVEPYYEIPNIKRRYAHKNCSATSGTTQERKDEIELEQYIKTLFKVDFIPPLVKTQISEYVNEKKMTLTGIKKTLLYYFDILHNRPNFINPTIGIVPYKYLEAKAYFEKLYNSVELNKGKDIRKYRPEVVKVTIRAPEREPLRRRELFTFLDEEVKDGE